MEFREFSNPEEEDFDIKSGLRGNEEKFFSNNSYNANASIELTELIGLLEEDELENIEELYGITQEEYMHPTKEVLEKVKNHLLAKKSHHL